MVQARSRFGGILVDLSFQKRLLLLYNSMATAIHLTTKSAMNCHMYVSHNLTQSRRHRATTLNTDVTSRDAWRQGLVINEKGLQKRFWFRRVLNNAKLYTCRRWRCEFVYNTIFRKYVADLMTHGKINTENYLQFAVLKLSL